MIATSIQTNMAFLLLWFSSLVVVPVVPLSSLACPEKCLCSDQGNVGSPSYKKIVNCTGKLGDLNGFPSNIPLDATHL